MNILISGGFEANYTVGLARGLASNGVDLCVISCDETAPRLTAAGIANLNLRGSLDSKRHISLKLANLTRYYVQLLCFLFCHRGATVHFAGIFRREWIVWDGLVLNRCFRLLASRYLYTVHNVLPHNREQSRFLRWTYRRIYREPHRLLVHTLRDYQQLMTEFGVHEERLQLTSIGLNEEIPVTGLTGAEARSRLRLAGEDRVVLFFGKIDEYKGLDNLLTAFDGLNLPETRLVIAGSFRNPAYRARIHRQLEGMTRRNAVHFHERFIPNDEVEVFFKVADVLCLPYRNIYQSGLVFLGPRFGIPMIATDVGSLREFLGDDLGLVTRTNDAAGLAHALNKFMAAPDRFSSCAILQKAQKHRWVNVCRELAPLYSARTNPMAAGSDSQHQPEVPQSKRNGSAGIEPTQ